MPSVSGNLKSDKITIQGHGTIAEDIVMSVESDTFVMKMGSDVLMTVTPDGSYEINDGGSSSSTLTLNRDTVITGTLQVTGVASAPTAATGTNTTQLATTAFVHDTVIDAITGLVGGAGGAYDTLQEIQSMLVTDASGISSLASTLATKASLNSPTLTGIPTAPTAAVGGHTTQIATTEFVKTAMDNLVGNGVGVSEGVLQHLMRDPTLPTFAELENTSLNFYGDTRVNDYAPHFQQMTVEDGRNAVDIYYPEKSFRMLNPKKMTQYLENMFTFNNTFLPGLITPNDYAWHNMKGKSSIVLDVIDTSGVITCAANDNITVGTDWYAILCDADSLSQFFRMLFRFKYNDSGLYENNTTTPTHLLVILPEITTSLPSSIAMFINAIPITTDEGVHTINVGANINSVLWKNGVLSIAAAKLYSKVAHSTMYDDYQFITTEFNKVTLTLNAVNFIKLPTYKNVYKSYTLRPDAFIQTGAAYVEHIGNLPERTTGTNIYEGYIAMPYNSDYGLTVNVSSLKRVNLNASTFIDLMFFNTKQQQSPFSAKVLNNNMIFLYNVPYIVNINKNGLIDMGSYIRTNARILMHEYNHSLMYANSYMYNSSTTEADATYFECLPGINEDGDVFTWRQALFTTYRNSCINQKTFMTAGDLSYSWYLFYIYMSKYDQVDAEFVRNPRFWKEYFTYAFHLPLNYSYNVNGQISVTDASGGGLMSLYDIYNHAYKIIKDDNTADIRRDEYENIVMASILNMNQYEADTIYSGSHSSITNWAYPDYYNMDIYKGRALSNLDATGELKPQIRSMMSHVFADAPDDCTLSQEYAINTSYVNLQKYSSNIPITSCRTIGNTNLISASFDLVLTLEPYSSSVLNYPSSNIHVVTDNTIIVRTIDFPSESNLTITDVMPSSSGDTFVYDTTRTSATTLVLALNNTNMTCTYTLPNVFVNKFITFDALYKLGIDIMYGVLNFTGSGAFVETRTASISNVPLVSLGPATSVSSMKVGHIVEFYDSNNASLVSGKVVILKRGELKFTQKADNAFRAGAVGLIIVDTNESTGSDPMAWVTHTPMTIPVIKIRPSAFSAHISPFMVTESDGQSATASWNMSWSMPFECTPNDTQDPPAVTQTLATGENDM